MSDAYVSLDVLELPLQYGRVDLHYCQCQPEESLALRRPGEPDSVSGFRVRHKPGRAEPEHILVQ
jgi:hypothetical protein